MDRVDEWRLFMAVARLASFSRAASEHRCSPQAATRAIAALEARIGARLFHRTTRSVVLTAEGERYVERARRALAEMDALETPADADPVLRGVLTVTAPVVYGQLRVVPLVADFLRRHRGVELRLVLLDRVVSLAEEGIDVAFRIGALPDSSLRARVVSRVRSVVCASGAYLRARGVPEHPSALEDHDVVAFTATTPIADRWSFVVGPRRRSFAVRPRLVVNDARAAIDAAVAGLGLVRVLSYQVEPLVRARKLRVVLASFEPEPLPVHVVQLPGVASRAATAFVERSIEALGSARERSKTT